MPELPLLGGLPATGLHLLVAEFAVTISNPEVWLSIGLALVLAAGCLASGIWVARRVGLLPRDAPAGETLGVGLATGLMVLTAWWAAIWSGGRSSFTPVAVGFALAIGLASVRRVRRRTAQPLTLEPAEVVGDPARRSGSFVRRSLLLTTLAGGVFIVTVALLYGSTVAPSPRGGVQPVEFNDAAYYSVLGRVLANTGTETNVSISGFSDLPGTPTQSWYHWGELWLASAIITIFGSAPLAARYFIVLPMVLLAAAALTGTLVRRMVGVDSRRAYLFGFLASLFLAPVPLPGSFFSAWPAGLTFGITLYGLAAVAALLALYIVAVVRKRSVSWPLIAFVGSAVAFVLPAHIVIAIQEIVGLGSVWALRFGRSALATRRLPQMSPIWRHSLIASAVFLVATVAYGLFTEHALGDAASTPNVPSFNLAWLFSVAYTYLGAGVLLTIPIAAVLLRKTAPLVAYTCFGTVALVVLGAIAWGARLGDFSMFHVFYGGIAVFATPVAAVAAWGLFEASRRTRHQKLMLGAVVLCVVQFGLGLASSTFRLQEFGPRLDQRPISVMLLESIRHLPAGAKLAYSCRPYEEISFVDSSLLSIDAHTDRRVIPMCYEADVFSTLNGVLPSTQVPTAGFALAPQLTLYPSAEAVPSQAAVVAFLSSHGIDYIFVDAQHPNGLVDNASPIAAAGDGQVLRVP